MRTSQLEGKYARLRLELADAYAAPTWPVGHIDRLTTELIEVEQSLQLRYRSSTKCAVPGSDHSREARTPDRQA